MTTIRISAPAQAQRGEIIQLKAMIQHDMETGYRRDAYGEQIPRQILKQFSCSYAGKTVFSAEFFPAIAANPFLSFFARADSSGELLFTWEDQNGQQHRERRWLDVV